MDTAQDQQKDRIAALATPFAAAALAVIRTAGAGSIGAVADLTADPSRVNQATGNTLVYTKLIDPETTELIDEVVLAIYRAPRSYTGDDSVEVFCHGSPPGIQRILRLLYRNGFRQAEPGEFTLRAFLAGKLDLTRSEAVNELVNAQTSTAHEMAMDRLGGSVESAIDELKGRLVKIMAHVAVQIDYPEDEIDEIAIPREEVILVRRRLEELAATYRTGRLYSEGVKVAIGGRTNAGKSSLFNALLREDRAIVSEIHGTTRDYIASRIEVGGVPIEIFDTAGLRDAVETIEEEGIRRSHTLLENADLVVYLVDGAAGLVDEDRQFLQRWNRGDRLIRVWNKTDLTAASDTVPEGYVPVSAKSIQGLERLHQEILRVVTAETITNTGTPIIDSLRQRDLIERAAEALENVEAGLDQEIPVDAIGVDLQEAIASLGEITGEVTSEDVLDAVFSGFCLGK